MSNPNWQDAKALFHEVVDLAPEEREGFLSENCSDEELRREIDELLFYYEESEEFIKEPAIVDAGIISTDKTEIGDTIGNYKIVREIGRGGMGTVYLAVRAGDELNQKVALKIIKRGMDTDFIVHRFRNERQILAGLNHPNIARLFEGGTTADGLPYFAMEYVDGQDLISYCNQKELSFEKRLNLFREVCSAVSYAHQNLVVHRDLKPSNILVTNEGSPKLLDFGIAKILSADDRDAANEGTTEVFRLLTPEYASPEQMRGERMTTASDVYSLGIILYELLTGESPYQNKSRGYDEIVRAVCETVPECSSSSRKNEIAENKSQRTKDKGQRTDPKSLKGDLDSIILKALRKEPLERYNSVQQFSEDISRFLQDLPVLARPQTLGYRFGKYFRRHKIGVAAAALVLLSLVGGISIATWQSIVAKRERDRATARFEKLRETAKLLMNETRDTLDYLPGTINLRQTFSEKSVDLLDSFYDDNSTDPGFLKELADAYEKLGKTQLWEFRQLSAAKKNVEKSIEIRRKILILDPQNIQRKIELSKSLSNLTEVIYFQRDSQSLLTVRNEAEALLRSIAEREPTNENLSNLAQHLMGYVGTYKEFHLIGENGKSLDEANSIFQKIIEDSQHKSLTEQSKTDLAWNLICQGGIFKHLKRDEEALAKFEQAANLTQTAYTSDNTLQLAFNYNGFAHRMSGEIYERRGEYQKAFEMYRYSFDWLKLRENNEAQSKPNLAWAASNSANHCALMLQKLGREKEAQEIIVKPWKDYSNFLEQETNASSIIYAVEPLEALAKYFSESNRFEEAAEIWRRHSHRIQIFLDKNPDDVDFIIRRARIENAIGDIYSAYDEKSSMFKTSDKERLSKAKNTYQVAAEFCRKSHKLYNPTQAEKDNLQSLETKISQLEE